jgi:starch synthase
MNILFIAAEASPLIKVGGLGDVIGSLPKALKKLGHDVRVMLPRYSAIHIDEHPLSAVIKNSNIRIQRKEHRADLLTTRLSDGMFFYLIDNMEFFDSVEIYGGDELKRFLFFDKAVVTMLPELNWQPDIIHCHDWHTAFIPMWLRNTAFKKSSLFTIHNLTYQGYFDSNFISEFGLKRYWQNSSSNSIVPPHNFICQGIVCSDMVNTVSVGYAREAVTAEYGAGLENILRSRQDKFVGILNGIDYEVYNPATDRFIASNYNSSQLDARQINKLFLQKSVGLPENGTMPIIGIVSRLDEQKGIDIIIDSLDRLFEKMEAQLIVLGRGRSKYQRLLKKAAGKHQHCLAVSNDYDEVLANHIYSGCDMFLMPSRFEPCGLGQLIAMRYGAIPIVRHTGGLVDTVEDLSPDLSSGSGFVFREYTVDAMLTAISRAINAYKKRDIWQEVIRRVMSLDFSWHKSAQKYDAVYQNLMELQKYVTR